MTGVKTGGPAFPGNYSYIDGMASSFDGMDLRDWIAGQALSGVIVQCAADHDTNKYAGGPATYFAMKAYEIADAMLAEKEKATIANKRDLDHDLPF